MAWQVLLVKLPDSLGSLSQLPAGYIPPPIGEPELVAQQIASAAKRACVTLDGDGSRLVVLRSTDFVIEAELGGLAEIDRVVLNVLGSDAALPLVGTLAKALNASAVDCETDEVLDADAIVPDTLREWQVHMDNLR